MGINPYEVEEREKRIGQVLNYKQRLTIGQTAEERKFFSLLLNARELKEAHRKTKTAIHRQHIFTDGRIAYIADFYLPEYKIVFEVDGHHHKQTREYDAIRTRFINAQGVRVVRFWNDQINDRDIVQRIVAEMHKVRMIQ